MSLRAGPTGISHDVVAADPERLVRAAADALGNGAAALLRVEPDGEVVLVSRTRGGGEGLAARPVGPVADAIARRAPAEGTPPDALAALIGCERGDRLLAAPVPEGDAVAEVLVCAGAGARAGGAAERAIAALAESRALARALEAERRAGELAASRLASLVDAGMALAGELALEELLERLVRTAREVLGARYAALGVLNAERTALSNFVTAGLGEREREAIGEPPRGRGILGALIRDARPLRLDSISEDPRSVGFPPNHPPMESFLGVPIALRGEVFGNLYITEKVGGPFTADDEQMALTLAAQAAVAIDNARRYRAKQRRVEELQSVQEVARAVLATLDLDQLLPLVARHARRLTGADTVGVALVEGDRMIFRHAHGTRALALESLALPADLAGLPDRLRDSLGAAAAQVAPLEIRYEVAGALAAVSDAPFDEPARRLLDTFSSQAAIAVANARTFAEERQRLLTSAEVEAARARERVAAESLRRAIQAQEAERARIALELHDEAGQVLTGLALHLQALEAHVDPEGRERLGELRALANQAASSMRDMATRLRPSGLREHGLASALERQAARVRQSGVSVDLAVDSLPADLPEEVEIAIFRVVQEALTNVVRHSQARHASVLATGHDGRIRVVVEDDGRGFDPEAPTGRLGLAGVRERVELLGGRLRIEAAPGAGAAVIVDLEVPS